MTKRLCFLGKKSLDGEENDLLHTLGMGFALAGYQLFTLPGFSKANDQVIAGFKTVDPDGVFDLRQQKDVPEEEINSWEWVVYPDDPLWRALDKRQPVFWAAPNWTAIPTKGGLRLFTEAMLQYLGDEVRDNGSVGLRSR